MSEGAVGMSLIVSVWLVMLRDAALRVFDRLQRSRKQGVV
jgi:hypothetical protein